MTGASLDGVRTSERADDASDSADDASDSAEDASETAELTAEEASETAELTADSIGAGSDDDGAGASLDTTAELDGSTGVTGVGVPRLKIQMRPTITITATMMIIQVLRFICLP